MASVETKEVIKPPQPLSVRSEDVPDYPTSVRVSSRFRVKEMVEFVKANPNAGDFLVVDQYGHEYPILMGIVREFLATPGLI